jgi:hypothetical protein
VLFVSPSLIYCIAGVDIVLQMKKGGALLRKELNDITYLESHPEIFQMFRDVGCYRYCEKLQGFHQGVAEAFALTFDGAKAKVGTIELQVNEAIVAAATEMPRTGERWFKSTITKDIEFRSYLKPETNVLLGRKISLDPTWKKSGNTCSKKSRYILHVKEDMVE